MDALGDVKELRDLDRELTRLAVAIRCRYQPAAERLGCSRLVDELNVYRLQPDQGTGYAVLSALRACLDGDNGPETHSDLQSEEER